MTMPTNILVPTDFGDLADRALDYAIELAGRLGATIHLVHHVNVPVLGIPDFGMAAHHSAIDELVRDREAGLERLLAAHRGQAKFGSAVVRIGDPRDAIAQLASELHADLIVMGTHGRHAVSRTLLGSVAEAVVRTAPCAVTTLRTAASA
jgi:glycine betaine transporter